MRETVSMMDVESSSSATPKPSVIVAQVGARMHYAVPVAFERLGMLRHFYTDMVAAPAYRALLKCWPAPMRPAVVQRFLGRIPQQIPAQRITCAPRFAAEFHRRRGEASSPGQLAEVFRWSGRAFCERVLRGGFRKVAESATTLYTFSWGGLELLEVARKAGLSTVSEQYIAPFVEAELLAEERAQFPGWEADVENTQADDYLRWRVTQEWQLADVVICPSDFVKGAVVAGGVDPTKCRIVPYAVDPSRKPIKRKRRSGKLRVLTVGAVGLRKGAPYILEAAKLMRREATFRMVGACDLTDRGRRALEAEVELTGAIPRSQMQEQFAWADVFLLPSLCEGSATATYEAMCAGLPVVCTPNTGSVVREGIEGKIVPIRSPAAIVDAVRELANDRLRRQMALAAADRSRDFTVDRYADRLRDEVERICEAGVAS